MGEQIQEMLMSLGLDAIKSALALAVTAISSGLALVYNYFRKQKLAIELKLQVAMSDIEFLLEVEREHGRLHAESGGQSLTNIARRNVKNHSKLTWSGKFTPSRIARRKQSMPESTELMSVK